VYRCTAPHPSTCRTRRTYRTRRTWFPCLSLLWLALLNAQLQAQNLDGNWLTDGYGYFIQIDGPTLTAREITSVSCLFSFTANRQTETPAGSLAAFKQTQRAATMVVLPGGSSQEVRLHLNGTASDMVLRRVAARPAICERPMTDTALTNFDVFAATWAEHYGFFDLKGADWKAIVAAHRSRVTGSTTPEQLLEIFKRMIEPFEDAHTFIAATTIKQGWQGSRRGPNWLEPSERSKAYEVTDKKYLRSSLQSWCNGQVQYALLDSNVGYMRIKSFNGYGKEPGFESGLIALEQALDAIFADTSRWSGLVIDVRINGGGADPYGLAIASRLATREYLAYSKEARNDPNDPRRWTEPQPSMVRPSDRPGFKGRVIELIGLHSVSAAETFTQALMKREPKVIRVGENTQGVFSDVLGRVLPNGWRIGLPNERFLTDGKNYDGPGIPPDVGVPVFPKSDLETGRDGAIEKALELLGVGKF
jgi:hypothetical protein